MFSAKLNCFQSNIGKSDDKVVPSWVGIRSFLSKVDVPETHVGFILFIQGQ